MNAYLKEIGDLCEIKMNLTFHLARHTFATTITLSLGSLNEFSSATRLCKKCDRKKQQQGGLRGGRQKDCANSVLRQAQQPSG